MRVLHRERWSAPRGSEIRLLSTWAVVVLHQAGRDQDDIARDARWHGICLRKQACTDLFCF